MDPVKHCFMYLRNVQLLNPLVFHAAGHVKETDNQAIT